MLPELKITSRPICNISLLIFFQSVWRTKTEHHLTTDLVILCETNTKPQAVEKRRGNESKANHFSMSKLQSMRIFPDEFWLRRPTATAGPCPFINGWVTIKSQRFCNGFSGGVFVWLRRLCTIYAVFPELWRELLNIHSDVSPTIPRVGISKEKPH